MRRYGINIPYLILSHPEIVGEDMISWTIAWEMYFVKAIQVLWQREWRGGEWARKPTWWQSNALVSGSWFVTAGILWEPRAWRYMHAHRCHHSHMISILLLFIGHLGSRKTGPSQWCKEGSKAQCFGLVKCTIKPFKMSSTRQRLKTNVAFWLSMGTT